MTSSAPTRPIIHSNRLEFLLIGIVLLCAIVLRAWGLSDLGLIHFDEGVYAISGWGMASPDAPLYAKQILFSPPLFFSLVGAAYWIVGEASDKTAILVSVVVGGATVALIWGITRHWLGRAAGVAAAVLAAFSEFHIAYSRMVLTDVTFGFLYVLSLASIAITLETGSFRWAVLSGLAVGAVWNTKYHGWFPLFLTLIVLAGFWIFGQSEKLRWKRLLACWMIMAGIAVACYLPWAAYVQSQPGGYLSLMKYQRTYLNPHWLLNLWRQAEMQWYMDGWLSRASPGVAYLLALALHGDRLRLGRMFHLLAGGAMLASGLVLGGTGTGIALSILALPSLARRRSFWGLLLLGSLGFLLFVTPLYRPYPRLLIPWVLVLYIVAGAGINRCMAEGTAWWTEGKSRPTWRPAWLLWGAMAVVVGVLSPLVVFHPAPRTWMATDSVRESVAAMAGLLPREGVVFVHGAPEVAFYFLRVGLQAIPIDYPIDHQTVVARFHPGGDNHFLVTGVYSQRDPRSRPRLKRLEKRLQLLGVFPIKPNDVRILNDFIPSRALHYRTHPTNEYDLRLYKVGSALEQESKP